MNARTLSLVSLALLAVLPAGAAAQVGGPLLRVHTVVASGNAVVAREPDVAHVSLAVETNADRAAEATQQNARVTAAVRAAVVKLGVPASKIVTQSYDLRYQPRPEPTGAQLRRPLEGVPGGARYGYVVTHVLDVSTATAGVGAVIDAAIGAGATSVGGVSFDIADRRRVYLEALREAVADAHAQAAAVAAAAGVHLGAVERIVTGGRQGIVGPVPLEIRAEGAAPPTEITPGAVRISATVTVIYAISP